MNIFQRQSLEEQEELDNLISERRALFAAQALHGLIKVYPMGVTLSTSTKKNIVRISLDLADEMLIQSELSLGELKQKLIKRATELMEEES